MNKAILIGRITNDIELRKTQNNKSYCEFNLAVNRRYSENTDFLKIQCWNQSAEYLSQYATKGTQISVEGRIETSNYEKDGQMVYRTYISAENVEILKQPSSKENDVEKEDNKNFGGSRANSGDSVNISQDELPFY